MPLSKATHKTDSVSSRRWLDSMASVTGRRWQWREYVLRADTGGTTVNRRRGGSRYDETNVE